MQRPCLETRSMRRAIFFGNNDDAHVLIPMREQYRIVPLIDDDFYDVRRQGSLGHFSLTSANGAQDDIYIFACRNDPPADRPVYRLRGIQCAWVAIGKCA